MAIDSFTNPLIPTGITGPPDIFFSVVRIVGDSSTGLVTVRFQLPAGFLWMPTFAAVSLTSAGNALIRLRFVDDAAVASSESWKQSVAVAGDNAPRSSTVVIPRMLIKTVTRDAVIEFITTNVDLEASEFYVRVLRYRKADAPLAFQAFLVAPP